MLAEQAVVDVGDQLVDRGQVVRRGVARPAGEIPGGGEVLPLRLRVRRPAAPATRAGAPAPPGAGGRPSPRAARRPGPTARRRAAGRAEGAGSGCPWERGPSPGSPATTRARRTSHPPRGRSARVVEGSAGRCACCRACASRASASCWRPARRLKSARISVSQGKQRLLACLGGVLRERVDRLCGVPQRLLDPGHRARAQRHLHQRSGRAQSGRPVPDQHRELQGDRVVPRLRLDERIRGGDRCLGAHVAGIPVAVELPRPGRQGDGRPRVGWMAPRAGRRRAAAPRPAAPEAARRRAGRRTRPLGGRAAPPGAASGSRTTAAGSSRHPPEARGPPRPPRRRGSGSGSRAARAGPARPSARCAACGS